MHHNRHREEDVNLIDSPAQLQKKERVSLPLLHNTYNTHQRCQREIVDSKPQLLAVEKQETENTADQTTSIEIIGII